MIDLTPAQLRLLKDAQAREDFVVSFYGQRETTKQKLIDGGLVETVLNKTPDEITALKAEVKTLCTDLLATIDTGTALQIGRIVRNISYVSGKIFGTKDVLTDLGKTV